MRRAVTLVELLVVIAIVAVLSGLLIPGVQSIRASATHVQCRNNLKNLGLACQAFHDATRCLPRNTIRPRGVTPVGGEPSGNFSQWTLGSYESWPRQIASYLEQAGQRTQDALPMFTCPADPRGATLANAAYGMSWYAGVHSNHDAHNDGMIVDDSRLPQKSTISLRMVTDGVSNTILLAERPPTSTGLHGRWDSPWDGDVISPARGDRSVIAVSVNGPCPLIAAYGRADPGGDCSFNSISSPHATAGNFCFGDGSVRPIAYDAGNQPLGPSTLLEALTTRSGGELVE